MVTIIGRVKYEDGEYSLTYSNGVIKWFDEDGWLLETNEKVMNKKLLLI